MSRSTCSQNRIQSRAVASAFTLHLKTCAHAKFTFKIPWYDGFWMSVKGPHKDMVTALGHIVKWP